MIGTRLAGRYQIIRHLGGGGFGQTYLAEDMQLPGSPTCVVKQLKPQSTDPQTLQLARRLFDQEAQMLYALGAHDQIPSLFAHVEENNEFYLVQEYIEGHTLDCEFTTGKRFSETEALALLSDVLEVLAFVHQQGVIHRDIKPANLMRRKSDGRIVLIDFGAVKQISTTGVTGAAPSLTVAIGSQGYTPSEQLAGRPHLSSDIYSIGIISIQALTALAPDRLRQSSRTGELIWKDKVEINPHLAQFIARCVRFDFRHRFQSATEALQSLALVNAPAQAAAMIAAPAIEATAPFILPDPIRFDSGVRTLAPTEVSPQYLSPNSNLTPQTSPQSLLEKFKGPMIIAGIFALLIAAMGTVVWMKASDKPGQSAKKSSNTGDSSNGGQIRADSDAYQAGLAQESEARRLAQRASTRNDWTSVADRWSQATKMMSSVKSSDPNYKMAQLKIFEYQEQEQYARTQAAVLSQNPTTKDGPSQTTPAPQPSVPQPPVIESAIMPPRLSERTYLTFNTYTITSGNSIRSFTTQHGLFDARIGTSGSVADAVSISFKGPKDWFTLNMKAPGGGRLYVGTYDNAQRYPFQAADRPGLDFSGNGSGCNKLTGRFMVYEISYSGDGEIEMIDVAFERRCEGDTTIIYGRLRYDHRDQR